MAKLRVISWVAMIVALCCAKEENSPDSESFHPYPTVCSKPCGCDQFLPHCPQGVSLITDGCGCCPICPRQLGESCDVIRRCDFKRSLECIYSEPTGLVGICKVRQAQGCRLGDYSYKDGDTFKVDCRTQCTCQNGTYGCVSLCPQEGVRPSAKCHNPRLVRLRGDCCQEWLCDPPPPKEGDHSKCVPHHGDWTPCSTTCGIGLSWRLSNHNPECIMKNETKLCRLRPCQDNYMDQPKKHHLRRSHGCRATLKSPDPILLGDGYNCTSIRHYQPKYCGTCLGHSCNPSISTTKKVEMICGNDRLASFNTKDFLWILQCACKPC